MFSMTVDDTSVCPDDLKDRILQVLENTIAGLQPASDGTLYPLASSNEEPVCLPAGLPHPHGGLPRSFGRHATMVQLTQGTS